MTLGVQLLHQALVRLAHSCPTTSTPSASGGSGRRRASQRAVPACRVHVWGGAATKVTASTAET